MTALEFHPLADLFPLIEGEEFDQLVEDIRANGLRHTIILHEGKILDGRNRYRACLAASVEPETMVWREEWPHHGRGGALAYVLSVNLHRRHLTTDQRAAIAAELAALDRGGDRRPDDFKGSNDPLKPAMTINEAATVMKVSPASVKRAKARKAVDPEAHEQAKAGTRPKAPRQPKEKPLTPGTPEWTEHQDSWDQIAAQAKPRARAPEPVEAMVPTEPILTRNSRDLAVLKRFSGTCKLITPSGSLTNRSWAVRRASHNRRAEPVELFFSFPGGGYKGDIYELSPDEAREMAKALMSYANWLLPELPMRTPEPTPDPTPEPVETVVEPPKRSVEPVATVPVPTEPPAYAQPKLIFPTFEEVRSLYDGDDAAFAQWLTINTKMTVDQLRYDLDHGQLPYARLRDLQRLAKKKGVEFKGLSAAVRRRAAP